MYMSISYNQRSQYNRMDQVYIQSLKISYTHPQPSAQCVETKFHTYISAFYFFFTLHTKSARQIRPTSLSTPMVYILNAYVTFDSRSIFCHPHLKYLSPKRVSLHLSITPAVHLTSLYLLLHHLTSPSSPACHLPHTLHVRIILQNLHP